MEEGILSLRWNNHPSAFIHCLGTLLQKETYSDVTLACDGHFFPVHKLVLSVCSEYFEAIFNKTSCTKPVIVLKDIRHSDMLALLHYMYVGEANVPQSDLSRLIKAAECLRIKGLAVPDESPPPREKKRPVAAAEPSSCHSEQSAPKKRKPDLINSVHNDGLEQLSDGEDITEIRRAVVQHTAQPSRQMSGDVPQQLTVPVAAAAASQVTILHSQQNATHQIHFQQQQPSHHQHQINDDLRSTQDDVLVSHTIPEVLVEECPAVKEEAKDPIKEEGSGRSNSVTVLDGGTSDGEEDDEEDASEHTSTSGAGLMHDLLAIPGGAGQQQETLVSWDGSSGSLTSYTLEGLIPDELRQHQPGVAVIRQHVCVYCGKRSFRDTTDLRRHIRTHTGERPYPCEMCPYSATQLWHLRRHIARIHGTQSDQGTVAEEAADGTADTSDEQPPNALQDSSMTLDKTIPQVIILEHSSSPSASLPCQSNSVSQVTAASGQLLASLHHVDSNRTKSYSTITPDDLSHTQNSLLFLPEDPTTACSPESGRAGTSFPNPGLGSCVLQQSQQEEQLTPGT